MPSITIRDLPEDLHQQLQREAEANFRSLDQEAAARLAKSLETEYAVNTERDQKWIDEAIASGPPTAFNPKDLEEIRDRILKKAK